MRRQSDIEIIIVKLDQGLVLVQALLLPGRGVMPFPGSKTGDRHFHATLINRPGWEVRPENVESSEALRVVNQGVCR